MYSGLEGTRWRATIMKSQLMTKAPNSGTPEAFDNGSKEKYARLRSEIRGAINRCCPSWLAGQCEDLIQVAMMSVLRLERNSEGIREFSTSYLYKVAYTTVIDEIRRLRRRREVPIDNPSHGRQQAVAATGPEQVTYAHEVGRAIEDCLSAMRRERRLAVTLHLLGHSVADSAGILGWDRKRTENLVYRGMSDLRECLASRGLQP